MMHEQGKSDDSIVPQKSPNNDGRLKPVCPDGSAEEMEERGSAKGNSPKPSTSRTQRRVDVHEALARIGQAAQRDRSMRFTTLLHHVYNPAMLEEAYLGLKRTAAPGIDGQTWQAYGADLEGNLQALSARLKRGAYRAKPTRRTHVPKADGRQRPLGVMTLEDKIVQRATTTVLNAIYEVDFLGFSYGFRPRRSPHHALDALYTGLLTRKVNWVLDADLRGFFDTIDRQWLIKFMEHRIADRRILRLIQKWLNAGVLEEGQRIVSEKGTVQGGSISPLLANIYLHYVFDLWTQQWRKQHTHADLIVVRYADDFIVGFQSKTDAETFLAALQARVAHFGLQLHADKTRLIEFGPFAENNRRDRGQGKPETFNFLGFTHICGRKRSNGRFTVLRQTQRARLQTKLGEIKTELRRRFHEPIPMLGRWLASVIRGHVQYYGVPMNGPALTIFRFQVVRLWQRALSRRSHKGRVRWERMYRLVDRYLPKVRICHPYPLQRMGVTT